MIWSLIWYCCYSVTIATHFGTVNISYRWRHTATTPGTGLHLARSVAGPKVGEYSWHGTTPGPWHRDCAVYIMITCLFLAKTNWDNAPPASLHLNVNSSSQLTCMLSIYKYSKCIRGIKWCHWWGHVARQLLQMTPICGSIVAMLGYA